ncbi:MAG: hypothetical protein KC550_03515 [Nanoarchaeota archaeon]|nr:hypothetical protein [Nanoarchaeota archaeon]
MEDKIYEVGESQGDGGSGVFFRLKGYPRLGVKISRTNTLAYLNEELEKAKILRKLGISVPKYVGIIKVKIPENEIQKNSLNAMLKEIPKFWNALVVEYIDSDVELCDSSEGKSQYFDELEKVRKLGIEVSTDVSISKNVLWSEKKQKMYFCDVEFWEIPDKYY